MGRAPAGDWRGGRGRWKNEDKIEVCLDRRLCQGRPPIFAAHSAHCFHCRLSVQRHTPHRATKLTEEMPDQKKTRALAAKATVSHTASWMPLSGGGGGGVVCV